MCPSPQKNEAWETKLLVRKLVYPLHPSLLFSYQGDKKREPNVYTVWHSYARLSPNSARAPQEPPSTKVRQNANLKQMVLMGQKRSRTSAGLLGGTTAILHWIDILSHSER